MYLALPDARFTSDSLSISDGVLLPLWLSCVTSQMGMRPTLLQRIGVKCTHSGLENTGGIVVHTKSFLTIAFSAG